MKMSEMGELQLSKLRYYSMGVVAEDKKLGSDIIQVTPLEEVSFVDGEVVARLNTDNVSGLDASGASYSAPATSSAAISATWMRISDPNRLTSPDVRRGEPVVIYQFGDENKFWWTTVLADHKYRRLETVIYGISGTSNSDVALGPDNMYWFEWSTHKRVIHIHTGKANGEPFAYDIQLDTGNGVYTFKDDAGQTFQFDSKERRMEYLNADGSHVDIHGRNGTISVPDTMKIQCNDMIVEARNSVQVDATNSVTVRTKDTTVESSNSFKSNSPNTAVIGSGSLKLTGGRVNTTGSDITVHGSSSIDIASPKTTFL